MSSQETTNENRFIDNSDAGFSRKVLLNTYNIYIKNEQENMDIIREDLGISGKMKL